MVNDSECLKSRSQRDEARRKSAAF